ncbi:MAG TPA: hypothetical protein VKA15_11110 [Isosphaeraceae bacterium]|nr:hypothetical protein [Isosphaeraceae bacterium]
MKAWVWVIVGLVGFGVMLAAYASRERLDPLAPWASGSIVISSEASPEKTAPAQVIPARLRLLSASDAAELMLFALGDAAPDKALGVKGQVRISLIEVPLAQAGIGADLLQSGRLPEAGRNEVLAGARIEPRETVIVGGQSLKVVGVLKPDLALFARSFLLPPDDAANQLFPAAVPTVLHAWLVRASAEELRDEKVRKPLEEAFPTPKYAWFAPPDRLAPQTFYLYLAGLAVLLLGGSGALIGLFRWLAGKFASPALDGTQTTGDRAPGASDVGTGKVAVPFLAGPLLEMKARPRLVWGVHLVYFGLVIAGSLLIYEMADAQHVLLGKVREALGTKSNPLGVAAQAYLSRSIPRAAVVTFLINFLIGALAYITLPSILLPGIGVFLAAIRAILWGLILAPVMQSLAHAMLPHSLTMLLEGEGYILATLFGLLIPIHIVQSSLGGNPLTRFGRVLLLNFKASFWIALVLAVAAIYEATEVILMNG